MDEAALMSNGGRHCADSRLDASSAITGDTDDVQTGSIERPEVIGNLGGVFFRCPPPPLDALLTMIPIHEETAIGKIGRVDHEMAGRVCDWDWSGRLMEESGQLTAQRP